MQDFNQSKHKLDDVCLCAPSRIPEKLQLPAQLVKCKLEEHEEFEQMWIGLALELRLVW